MKYFLFDSLFSSESCVFSFKVHPPMKVYHFKLYIIENRGLGRLPDDVGFIPNQVFNVENLSFLVSKTLTCVLVPMYAYACMKYVHTELEHACTYACTRTHALGFSWSLFKKRKKKKEKKKAYLVRKEL